MLLGDTNNYDFVITEIGGTVGDIESLPYIEAVRQIKWELQKNAIYIHLTLVPYLSAAGELKTKPTQHSVKTLLESGIQPDILVCRTEHHLNENIKQKIALFCNVEKDAVIESMDAKTIYEVPLLMQKEKLDQVVLRKLNVNDNTEVDLKKWNSFLQKLNNPNQEINIGLVGKYIKLKDSYKSIYEALIHAGTDKNCKVNIKWIHAEELTDSHLEKEFEGLNGVLVAPGFGDRGIEGKINAIKYVREKNIPFLGICLGMQCAVVEFARNILNKSDANSTEMNPNTKFPVIDIMENQKNIQNKGGTMRLGAYNCKLEKNSFAHNAYKKDTIKERHRHRYEFNNSYIDEFNSKGMNFSGINPENNLVEIVEIPDHKWFVGVQFHPEYSSTVLKPHPLFSDFVQACINN